MRQNKRRSIYLSLFIAFMVTLAPWSGLALLIKPDFVLLVVIFWLIRAPNLCNVGTAWLVGVLVDLATGSLFGQYALAYTITAFLAVYYQRRLVLFSHTQQLLYVFLLLMTSQLTLLILKTFAGAQALGFTYWLSSITGIIFWRLAVAFGLKTGARSHGN